MENKLIPLSDFVQMQLDTKQSTSEFKETVRNYTEFLKQPLTLGMFIPVDENNVPLVKPADDDYSFYTHKNMSVQEEYKHACERVLFEGYTAKVHTECVITLTNSFHTIYYKKFKRSGNTFFNIVDESKEDTPNYDVKTVEDLINFDLTLTATAIKSIYGS